MYPPQSLDHLKQQQEYINAIGFMDGWSKIKHFGAQFGMGIGMISVLLMLDTTSQGWVIGIIILPIGIICALTFYGIASLLEYLYELIFE